MSTAAILICAPTHSQQASVLLGGVYARYADSVSGSAAVTSLRLFAASAKTAGAITTSLSKFSSGEWVTQVSGFGTAILPVAGNLSFGVSGGADANRIEGGSWNGQMAGGLLGVFGSRSTFATVGASLGEARTVYDSTVSTMTLNGRVQRLIATGVSLSGGLSIVGSDTMRFADMSMDLSYTSRNVRASLTAGVRAGDLADDPWGQGHMEWDFLPHLTYELSLGRYPQSLVGFTDGMYLTTGIKVRMRRGSSGSTVLLESPVVVDVLESGRVRIELEYSGDASTLEIVGGWNGWLPLLMQRAGGDRWFIELPLDPGIYQYAIVVDGDSWTVPDGVTAELDDFGGEMATLVVMEGGR